MFQKSGNALNTVVFDFKGRIDCKNGLLPPHTRVCVERRVFREGAIAQEEFIAGSLALATWRVKARHVASALNHRRRGASKRHFLMIIKE
ncbi:MAG: hypothetical protein LBB48_05745 [Treponema sp.]|jgi:hypothetical protein|nr:hypothetical protein [Treponema sp.]